MNRMQNVPSLSNLMGQLVVSVLQFSADCNEQNAECAQSLQPNGTAGGANCVQLAAERDKQGAEYTRSTQPLGAVGGKPTMVTSH